MLTTSLSSFVRLATERKIVVEFKDESAAEGVIETCDDLMNITLSDVKYFKRRIRTGPPISLETFFARGKFIRFVHFQFRNPDTLKSLISRLPKIEEQPRTKRVFGSQTKLPETFKSKLQKIQKRQIWRRF
jgi:small nuclear ribonucleoprotein (snRNP)-like protein